MFTDIQNDRVKFVMKAAAVLGALCKMSRLKNTKLPV